MFCTTYYSPVGKLTMASDGENLTGLWIEGQKYFTTMKLEYKDDLPIFDKARDWLDRYFSGKKPDCSELPLSPVGGEFRQTVWKLLGEIPYGQTVTYGELAKKTAQILGKEKMSAQAVGGAVGHNPISIIVPCHRVVGADGSLTGYAGGIGIKVRLLKLEGVDMSKLYVPEKGTAL